MTKRMLIDSTHAEETRVVVLDGNRLEDYDVETSTKRQLKGNIYLAKIVRVEPSLQAAFVEYGGNRHGFLAFGEIHPDYYQLPVADRQRLLEMQEAEAREDEEAEDEDARREDRRPPAQPAGRRDPAVRAADEPMPAPGQVAETPATDPGMAVPAAEADALFPARPGGAVEASETLLPTDGSDDLSPADAGAAGGSERGGSGGVEGAPTERSPDDPNPASDDDGAAGVEGVPGDAGPDDTSMAAGHANGAVTALASAYDDGPAEPPPEQVGGDADSDGAEEASERRPPPRFLRNYKIQEVIRRRQILLIQVVKEERGTKGAALTTYISLAGRFSVLMPNSPRGGGISRKITSAADRRRLKEVTAELDLPRGMGLIVRTAGANRPKPEIMRDGEYLLDQWDQIRDLTMRSTAPALIYEEANLIKRSIRDVYSRDVEDILVDGEAGWRAARDFMRMLMPTHARKVQLWKEPVPLFARQQVEAQLDAMLSPVVQLRSGGYLVINQTEALVAIDVNSGRSTRERGIEQTALGTNLEAADEVARQLRLRDLAGLIVIDFIDMEARRNVTQVEARLKNALKDDRARIQVGSISHFGLMEMSRQRLRPSLAETSFIACPACGGTGHVRSTESAALHVLRGIEDEGTKHRGAEIIVHVASSIALYILNHKRGRLAEIEARHGLRVAFASDDALLPPAMRIDRVRTLIASELPAPVSQTAPLSALQRAAEAEAELDGEIEDEDVVGAADADDMADDTVEGAAADAPRAGETAEEGQRRKRRRRRGRGRREDGQPAPIDATEAEPADSGDHRPDLAPVQIGITAAPPPDFGQPDLEQPAFAQADPDHAEFGLPDARQPGFAQPADAASGAAQDAAQDAQAGAAPPGAAPDEDAADEDAPAKRRGRRGGRRRRRDVPEGNDIVVAGATTGPDLEDVARPAPTYPTPSYSGPTPADPFGGSQAFDIFDAIEQAEQQRAEAAKAPQPAAEAPGVAQPVTASMAPEAGLGLTPPEPGLTEPMLTEPALAAQEPVGEMALAEPAAVVVPILVGTEEPVAEKKRGWWRK